MSDNELRVQVGRACHEAEKAWLIERGYADHPWPIVGPSGQKMEWPESRGPCWVCTGPSEFRPDKAHHNHPEIVDYDDLPEEARARWERIGMVAVQVVNEPIPDTYACQRCGRKDGLDTTIASALWDVLSEGRWNLLCLWCMDELAVEHGIRSSVSLHFAGKALHGTSDSAANTEHVTRLVGQRDSAESDLKVLRAEHERLKEAARVYLTCTNHVVGPRHVTESRKALAATSGETA